MTQTLSARSAVTSLVDSLRSERLEGLLAEWHQWQQNARVGRGFNNRALVVGEYRVSRQYDDANGALDDDLDEITMKQVDFQVREMAEPYRTAIYCLARALTLGMAVFTSPRLPSDRAQRDAVVAKAREMLTGRLVSAGVM